MKVVLGQLSWRRVLDLLTADPLSSTEICDSLIEDVVRTGCLIKKHATQQQRKARDAFRGEFRAFIVENCATDQLEYVDAHLLERERIERAFDTILASVRQCDISNRSIQEQVWAVVQHAVAEIKLVHKKLGEFVVRSPTADGFAYMNPLNVKIKDDQGDLFNPDALISSFIEGAGSSIKLLAYQGRLTDGNRIIVPPYISPNEIIQTEAGAHHYFANAWELIEEGSERVRYWDEELIVEDNGLAPSENGYQELFRFDLNLSTEVFFRTARLRLDQQLFQNRMKLQKLAKLNLLDPRVQEVPFAANTFVSTEEADAFIALDSVYNYPVTRSSETYGSLTLREWIRAYAVLEGCFARDTSGNHRLELIQLEREELKSTLVRASLTPEKAEAFIVSLIFSLDKLDLYDAPLLEDSNGQLHLFAPAHAEVSLPRVILSQIHSQNVQVQGKGELFEAEVLRMFNDAEIQAVGFKYCIDKQNFDCDAAVLWGDQLFIFECKNHGLPTGRASDDFYFIKKLGEAAAQVRRIGKQLAENPDLLKRHLGESAHWSETHLVVLNAMPISVAGEVDGVYFYDASALGKLLHEKQISIRIDPSGDMEKAVATFALWQGDAPQASDLVAQLNEPIQLKAFHQKLTKDWNYVHLSPKLLAGVPYVKSQTITPEEMLEALGHSAESAAAIMNTVKQRLEENSSSE